MRPNMLGCPSLGFGRGAIIHRNIMACRGDMPSHWKSHYTQSQKRNFRHVILLLQLAGRCLLLQHHDIVVPFAPIAPSHLAPPVYT